SFFGGFGHGALLATTSLGHIIGIGAIQGLAASGVL
ncbi:MAG TPA: photosystem I reaction center subunit PsaK, partial [Synechococcales bacterium UBA8138]|nr:photosystem I reaction center subunit PsaK [Synechococcales bacterium UBA8138]